MKQASSWWKAANVWQSYLLWFGEGIRDSQANLNLMRGGQCLAILLVLLSFGLLCQYILVGTKHCVNWHNSLIDIGQSSTMYFFNWKESPGAGLSSNKVRRAASKKKVRSFSKVLWTSSCQMDLCHAFETLCGNMWLFSNVKKMSHFIHINICHQGTPCTSLQVKGSFGGKGFWWKLLSFILWQH